MSDIGTMDQGYNYSYINWVLDGSPEMDAHDHEHLPLPTTPDADRPVDFDDNGYDGRIEQ